MQGMWQTKISGESKKGKRKKIKRKHILRDKALWYMRNHDKKELKEFKTEGKNNIVHTFKNPYKQTHADVYLVAFSKYIDIEYTKQPSTKVLEVFKYKNGFYTLDKKEFLYGNVVVLGKIGNIEICLDNDKPDFLTRKLYTGEKPTYFLYNKPLPKKVWDMYGAYFSTQRKYWQRQVHKRDRQNVRNYIKKADWDDEIKTHELSKSIEWQIW